MTAASVERIEKASPLRRAVEVWFAAFGGIVVWLIHLVFVASAEHWTYVHSGYGWTLSAATAVYALATVGSMVLARRLYLVAAGADAAAGDDAGQLLFLAQLGLLVGAINLALILLEGSYALLIPRS